MNRLHLAIHPAPARPWANASGKCARRAGGEVRLHASIGGMHGGVAFGGTKRSDRFGKDRTHSSAGGPGGGATGV